MKFTPDANCPMVHQALEGNTEAIEAYNEEFKSSLKVVVYTKSEKRVVSPYIQYVNSNKEEVKIKWKGKNY